VRISGAQAWAVLFGKFLEQESRRRPDVGSRRLRRQQRRSPTQGRRP